MKHIDPSIPSVGRNGSRIVVSSILAMGLLALSGPVVRAESGDQDTYMIVDLSGGPDAASYPVSFRSDVPAKGWGDDVRSYKLVLRKVPAGTFMMGSPTNELGRSDNEDLHKVTISQPFYIGVFEVTQRQWELVMGDNPSLNPPAGQLLRPVDSVTYDMLRGAEEGDNWPQSDSVDNDSFFGKLRQKTGKSFDLPSEAQWEYACRAGTTTALNNGTDLDDPNTSRSCESVANTCLKSRDDGSWHYDSSTQNVGLREPNEWGLYDMHGNVDELCLDWFMPHLGTNPVRDPKGPSKSKTERAPFLFESTHVLRGGSSWELPKDARSACRSHSSPATRSSVHGQGFRVSCP